VGTVVYVNDPDASGNCRVTKRSMRSAEDVERLALSIAKQISENGGIDVNTFHGKFTVNDQGVALIAAHLIDRPEVS